jgi:hypothetical protein
MLNYYYYYDVKVSALKLLLHILGLCWKEKFEHEVDLTPEKVLCGFCGIFGISTTRISNLNKNFVLLYQEIIKIDDKILNLN